MDRPKRRLPVPPEAAGTVGNLWLVTPPLITLHVEAATSRLAKLRYEAAPPAPDAMTVVTIERVRIQQARGVKVVDARVERAPRRPGAIEVCVESPRLALRIEPAALRVSWLMRAWWLPPPPDADPRELAAWKRFQAFPANPGDVLAKVARV